MKYVRSMALALAVSGAASSSLALAQNTTEDRLQRIETQLKEMESRHAAELQKRDAKIADLEKQLQSRSDTLTEEQRAKEIDRVTNEVLADIKRREAAGPAGRLQQAASNLQIAVAADFVANYSSRNVDGARNRADIREVELELRAPVDPRADAVVGIAFERDAAPELFGGEDLEGPETEAAIEEAYLFLHDFGVQNLTAKVGRYAVSFGRSNIMHLHELPTVDQPFVIQSHLAAEGLKDAGLSLSYVVPNPANEYIEAILEVNSGEGAGSESPTLRGDLNSTAPSVNGRVLWNKNLAQNLNLELGGSALYAPSENKDKGNRDLWLLGGDVTLVRRDPTGGFANQFLQAEVIYGAVDQEDGTRVNSWGAYVLGQQQLAKDWYAGLRLDYTQDANNSSQEIWGLSPYVTWQWSEFLRFRAQYQYREATDSNGEHIFFLQVTFVMGSHKAHPYWAFR